jgi:hypothetical protein
VLRGSSSREDGNEVVLGILARTAQGGSLAWKAAAHVGRHHRRYHRREACSTGACGLIDGVGRGQGETGGNPGKLGKLIRGAQPERPREKRQSGVVDIDGGLHQGVH